MRIIQIIRAIYTVTYMFQFQVMIQSNNRHMSISLYLTVLAVAETIILILGEFFECVNVKVSYLGPEYNQFSHLLNR